MAGHIPEIVIQDLVARTDLVGLINESVPLKKSGNSFTGLCPFHEEKTPSFSVSPLKNFYYCFGCSASGNAIRFLMDYHHLSFVESCENLATRLGMTIEKVEQTPEEAAKNQAFQQEKTNCFKALHKSQGFYSQQLAQLADHHPVKRYLKKRNITQWSIDHFKIGFAPSGWDHLKKHLLEAQIPEKDAVNSGMLTSGKHASTYDRFRNRLMFPIENKHREIIGFGGRVLGDEQPKYLNSPESPVFYKKTALFGLPQVISQKGQLSKIMLVEGYMDVIRMHQVGLPYALATLGTASSEDHVKLLFQITQHIIVCFDSDSAGNKAAWKFLELCLPLVNGQQEIEFLFLPEGQDPDSFIQEQGKEAFTLLEKQATPLFEYFYQALSQDLSLESLDHRAKLLHRALPLIKSTQTEMLKSLLVQRLAELTQLTTEKIESQLQHLEQSQNYHYQNSGHASESTHLETGSESNHVQTKSAQWQGSNDSPYYKQQQNKHYNKPFNNLFNKGFNKKYNKP